MISTAHWRTVRSPSMTSASWTVRIWRLVGKAAELSSRSRRTVRPGSVETIRSSCSKLRSSTVSSAAARSALVAEVLGARPSMS